MSIEIIATDKHSKKTTRRVFSLRNIGLFKPMVDEWLKKEVPFQECDLSTIDRIEDFTNEVRQILDELSVTEHKCELQQLCSKLIEELRIKIGLILHSQNGKNKHDV